MDRVRHLRNYDLHSWTGIALGFFVFIVALSGCFALFDAEIKTWEDPAKRITITGEPAPIHATYEAYVKEMTQDATLLNTSLNFPTVNEPYYTAYVGLDYDDDRPNEFVSRRWSAETGEALPEHGEGLSVWLLDFHRDLMWPDQLGGRTVGRSLVGIIGIILMLAIISGVVAHTKIFQELFSLRYWRSVRLKWQDTHKVAGLWGLPFFGMISFTGAYLGVIVILAPVVALLAFKGDQTALVEAVIGKPTEAAGIEATMMPVDSLSQYVHPESGAKPDRVVVNHWGDEAATYDLLYHADKKLAYFDSYSISAVTGEAVHSQVFDRSSPATRVSNAITPLHYATYGGKYGSFGAIALKLVYFLLGLALAIITAMGNMMWIERRKNGNEGSKSPAFYHRLGRFNVGVTTGMAFATASIFYLDKLYLGAEASRVTATGWTYFGVWFAVIFYALIRENEYRTVRDMLALTGLAFMGIPFLLRAPRWE
ncbi:MAG: PepSY-associated TM helix domain-containing protein [Pseudomonadota bacterium]